MPMSKGVKSQDKEVKIRRVIKRLKRLVRSALPQILNAENVQCLGEPWQLVSQLNSNTARHRDIGGCYRAYYWR